MTRLGARKAAEKRREREAREAAQVAEPRTEGSRDGAERSAPTGPHDDE